MRRVPAVGSRVTASKHQVTAVSACAAGPAQRRWRGLQQLLRLGRGRGGGGWRERRWRRRRRRALGGAAGRRRGGVAVGRRRARRGGRRRVARAVQCAAAGRVCQGGLWCSDAGRGCVCLHVRQHCGRSLPLCWPGHVLHGTGTVCKPQTGRVRSVLAHIYSRGNSLRSARRFMAQHSQGFESCR